MIFTAQTHLFFLFAMLNLLLGNVQATRNVKRIYIATQTKKSKGNANCSPQEKAALVDAIGDARVLAEAGSKALAVTDSENSPSFLGWFGSENMQYKNEIKTYHFDSVYSSLSLEGVKEIDWSSNTFPGRSKVKDKSIVFYCPHPPFTGEGDCKYESMISMTQSWKNDDKSFVQYAMIAICPKFFTLPTFADAGAAWALSRSNFQPSRGGNIFHESQHVHRITGNEERSVDAKVRVGMELSDCYTPDICWDNLKPYPALQRSNAQNYRFFAEDALWRPAEVLPPVKDWFKQKGIANITSVTMEGVFKSFPLNKSPVSFSPTSLSKTLPNFEPPRDISSHSASRFLVSDLSNTQLSASLFSSTTRHLSHNKSRSHSSQFSRTSEVSSSTIGTDTSTNSSRTAIPKSSSIVTISTSSSIVTTSTSSSSTVTSTTLSTSSISTTSSFTPTSSNSTTSSSTTSQKTSPVSTITSTRTTSSVNHGHTIVAFVGLVILAGAGGCFYELGNELFHVDDGDTETAGDSNNSPTSTLSFSVSMSSFTTTSSSTSSSESSSSSSSSSRKFINTYTNYVEDLDVAGLDARQCSSLHLTCSIGPETTTVPASTTSFATSSTTTSTTTSTTPSQSFPTDHSYTFDLCLFNRTETAPPGTVWPYGLYVHPTSDESGTHWWVYVPWVICDDGAYYTVYLNHSDGTVESIYIGGPATDGNIEEADSSNTSFPVLSYWWVATK